MKGKPKPTTGCDADCECGMARRDFIRLGAAGAAAALMARPARAMAGPFKRSDFEQLVPADKKLSAEWVASLFARGERTVYRGSGLIRVGMPVGGITCGQVYLGGDGRLWLWDIFNQTKNTTEEHYAKPMFPGRPAQEQIQGFHLRISEGGGARELPLALDGFSDITFCGEYPIGHVEYRDPGCPIAVSLEAFSPFCPLDVADSSLPATVMRFTLRNTGTSRVSGALTGLLENVVLASATDELAIDRTNTVERHDLAFLNPLQRHPPVLAGDDTPLAANDFPDCPRFFRIASHYQPLARRIVRVG
jgi:hypothetical protein